MAHYHDISIIGAGNVAWHLSQALENSGHHIHEVYSRQAKHAKALTKTLYSAQVIDSLDFSSSKSSVFIIAVKDDAIKEVAEALIPPSPNAIVVHTSGSVSIDVLGYALQNYGCFYPLQSFVKTRKIKFKEVPVFIEASNRETKHTLTQLAKTVTSKVAYLDSEQRKALHVSGVFASNFVNHLLSIAKQIALKHKIDFRLLEPLVIETINKALELGPEKAQTGPASRGDLEVLDGHFAFLEGDEALQKIYKALSQHILDQTAS